MFSPQGALPCVQKEWGGWSFLVFSFDFNDDSDPPKKKQLSILTVDGQRKHGRKLTTRVSGKGGGLSYKTWDF